MARTCSFGEEAIMMGAWDAGWPHRSICSLVFGCVTLLCRRRGLLLKVGKPRVEGHLVPSEFCRLVEK